jgi:hypothetical protein
LLQGTKGQWHQRFYPVAIHRAIDGSQQLSRIRRAASGSLTKAGWQFDYRFAQEAHFTDVLVTE